MSVKYGISFTALLFMLFSCSHKNQFPVKNSEKTESENIVLTSSLMQGNGIAIVDSVRKNNFEIELNELLGCKQFYEERNEQFDLVTLENLWNNLKGESKNFSFESVSDWIEITGFLLEITGKELYAQELENVVYQSSGLYSETELKQIENLIIPLIFTKNIDHIHVNLFANATVKYNHTLKGAVEIIQETDYPKSGKVQIKFKMEQKRYIELFIRIPEWAEGATVTEKGVKYVAPPGGYSKIVRKWSDGDFIEIDFPLEKMPAYLKTEF